MNASKSGNEHKVSEHLALLIDNHQEQKYLTFKELITALGEQAYGIVMILFALPSALPVSFIPGVSLVFGLPIVIIALHLILGRKTLWLPETLAARQISVATLSTIINKTQSTLQWIERYIKPRAAWFLTPLFDRLHGLILLLLSLLLLLPIPFSNMILSGLIILLGLGLAQRDGYVIIIAYLGSFLYFALMILMGNQLYKLIF